MTHTDDNQTPPLGHFGTEQINDRLAAMGFSTRIVAESIRAACGPEGGDPDRVPNEPETLPGPLIGVRALRYVAHTGSLKSINEPLTNGCWDGAQMAMHCPHGHTEPRLEGCGCGLHAYDSHHALLADPDHTIAQSPDFVRCVVKGYGAIAEAEYGFASQYMRPLAVILDQPELQFYGVTFDVLAAFENVACKLGVPLIDTADVAAFARNHGVYGADRTGWRTTDHGVGGQHPPSLDTSGLGWPVALVLKLLHLKIDARNRTARRTPGSK